MRLGLPLSNCRAAPDWQEFRWVGGDKAAPPYGPVRSDVPPGTPGPESPGPSTQVVGVGSLLGILSLATTSSGLKPLKIRPSRFLLDRVIGDVCLSATAGTSTGTPSPPWGRSGSRSGLGSGAAYAGRRACRQSPDTPPVAWPPAGPRATNGPNGRLHCPSEFCPARIQQNPCSSLHGHEFDDT
jgi:hypothetical protein